MMNPPILIVGAGPTGLVLALFLKRHGVAFRIVDRAHGPGEHSRALAVQARTLEFYRQLGVADRAVAAGTKVEAIRMLEGGKTVARVLLGDLGGDMSPFPFILCLPQDEHERLLGEALAEAGVAIEWETRLTALSQIADAVEVSLAGPRGGEQARFGYVAGCDGGHSTVREQLGVDMPGGTYDRLYYVADVRPTGEMAPEFVAALDPDAFALRLPSRKGANERLIGFVPREAESDPTFDAVRSSTERLLGIKVVDVNWFSTYRVHHRVAARFQAGRCFLLGDAGHVHSPAGGQGMNTGIGDAVNLSWKLAQVVRGEAPPNLLESYEAERIGFARVLVATTDRLFKAVADTGVIGAAVRGFVAPMLFPAVTGLEGGRHAAFRLVSQIRVAYRESALSEGEAGKLAGGDRLPWLPEADNFASLTSLSWQVHVFGDVPPDYAAAAEALGVSIHRFACTEAAKAAGFAPGAAFLVRPDGYIALAQRRPDGAALAAYMELRNLKDSPSQVAAS